MRGPPKRRYAGVIERDFTDPDRVPVIIQCRICFDMPHRRTWPNCVGCDEKHALEVIAIPIYSLQSSLGDCSSFPEGGPE